MHPQTNYGHLIATIEIFTGMSFLAVMTGLIFARFSRPRARFMLASTAVITRHEGRQTLMIRTVNARHNAVSRAMPVTSIPGAISLAPSPRSPQIGSSDFGAGAFSRVCGFT